MTITIEPLGGLGNQLFVYALGRQLADQLGTTLSVDNWRFHRYPWHIYELGSVSARIDRTYSSRARERGGHYARLVPSTLGRLGVKRPTLSGTLVLERSTTFDPRFLGCRNGTRLSGYFQSWRYFEATADLVRSEVSVPRHPSPWLHATVADLAARGPWTAVHVRRGNYTIIPGMGLADAEYYRRGLALVDRLHGELPVAVFSDDPAYVAAMEVFQGDRFNIVSTPPDVRAIEPLLAMSHASAMVIGNSTFSWWAAYLRDAPERSVVAPRPWLDSKSFDERDLLLPHWYTVGR